eukprot:162915-Pyramimonas_sp.AAC.1
MRLVFTADSSGTKSIRLSRSSSWAGHSMNWWYSASLTLYGGTVRGGGPRIRAYLHCMRRTASGRIKQCALGERIYLQLKGDAAHGSAVDALHKMLK